MKVLDFPSGCRCRFHAELKSSRCLPKLSNVFMTFAWYGDLATLKDKAWYVAAVISWGIAFFEYLAQ